MRHHLLQLVDVDAVIVGHPIFDEAQVEETARTQQVHHFRNTPGFHVEQMIVFDGEDDLLQPQLCLQAL